MRQIRHVLRLKFELKAESNRAIAKSLGISRDAVSDYLAHAEVAKLSWPLPPDMDDATLEELLFPTLPSDKAAQKTEPDWLEVRHTLITEKGATLLTVHQEYLEKNPGGMAYSYFCQRYREFSKVVGKRYMRQTHKAGEKVFVDYAGPTREIVNTQTGEIRYAQIFVGVLGASKYIYAGGGHLRFRLSTAPESSFLSPVVPPRL